MGKITLTIEPEIEIRFKVKETGKVLNASDDNKTLADGVYGLINGELKLHTDIKDEDLDSVEYIVVKKGYTCVKMSRKEIEGEYSYDEAQEKAAELGAGWRCFTRHEWIDIYDMRFNGLDNFRKRLGMSSIDGWYWTCEHDADPQYSASNAWFASSYGLLNYDYKRRGNRVCAVSAFQF